jgi:hypothetical protein
MKTPSTVTHILDNTNVLGDRKVKFLLLLSLWGWLRIAGAFKAM